MPLALRSRYRPASGGILDEMLCQPSKSQLNQKEQTRDGEPKNNEEPREEETPARRQLGFVFPRHDIVAHVTHHAFAR